MIILREKDYSKLSELIGKANNPNAIAKRVSGSNAFIKLKHPAGHVANSLTKRVPVLNTIAKRVPKPKDITRFKQHYKKRVALML